MVTIQDSSYHYFYFFRALTALTVNHRVLNYKENS